MLCNVSEAVAIIYYLLHRTFIHTNPIGQISLSLILRVSEIDLIS